MPEIKLIPFEEVSHRGAVYADGCLIGSWQLQGWVRGRARVYVAWLDNGDTLTDDVLARLQRKIQQVLLIGSAPVAPAENRLPS